MNSISLIYKILLEKGDEPKIARKNYLFYF